MPGLTKNKGGQPPPAKSSTRKTSTKTPTKTSNGKTLTVSQASRVLNAHPNSVRHWADIGLLPVIRVGRRSDRRFVPGDLAKFLRAWNEA